MNKIQAELPDELYRQAVRLVQTGWFRDENEIVCEAVRRFVESHEPELMEKFLRADVEWGLHGGE